MIPQREARSANHIGRGLVSGSPAGGNGAVQKARIIAPDTRATILLIVVGSCARALWTSPKPPTSVTQASASITTLRCVRRLSASAEKLFMTCSPKDVPVISRSEPAESSRHIENYFTGSPELCAPPPTKAIRMSSNSRNLLRRPAKPAQGRGRIQRGVWEQLVGHNGLATTRAVIAGLYPDKRLQNGGWYSSCAAG